MASMRFSTATLAVVGITNSLAMLVHLVVGASMILPHALLGAHFAAKVLAVSLVPSIVTMTLASGVLSGPRLALKLLDEILPIVWIAAYFATPTRAVEVATGLWFFGTALHELYAFFVDGSKLARNAPQWTNQVLATGELSLGVNRDCACAACRAVDASKADLLAQRDGNDAELAAVAREYAVALTWSEREHRNDRTPLD